MEILLIGNGFDLEHDLPTSYNAFLKFCKAVRRIYTDNGLKNIDGCEIDVYIKGMLDNAFKKRNRKTNLLEDGTHHTEVTTPNKLLDELYAHIKDNTWIEYFFNCTSHLGENWIDFESEISRVIQILDEARMMTVNGSYVTDIPDNKGKPLFDIYKASKWSLHDAFGDIRAIDNFAGFLNSELERLIRALEIYIAEFVHGITVSKKSEDIEKLNPDHILSFNYSDTYERVYGKDKKIKYDYIHGKADTNKNITTCNLVLGIDEYLGDERKDTELEFLTFKKFYQRMYKSTGNHYLDWVDEIKDGYAEYLQKQSDVYTGIVESKDIIFNKFPFQKSITPDILDAKCPEHTLYIFGHSLDITDRDILKLFICNDNVQTKIFYYRENEDDKRVLGKLIRNLIKIMGQDELIRRTGGAHKTIEFIPQAISEEKQ